MIPAALREQFDLLARHEAFRQAASELRAPEPAAVRLSGLTLTAKALYLTLLQPAVDRPLLVVTSNNRSAEALLELLATFHAMFHPEGGPAEPFPIPALDVLPGQNLSPHSDIGEQRAVGLYRLSSGQVSIAVTPVESLLLRTEPAEFYRQLALTVRVGDEIAMEDVARHLDSIGYQRHEPVEMEGEFSIRGGIFDVFPAEQRRPVRIEFFGDSVESLRRFEVETQRSVGRTESVTLLPLEETPHSQTMLRELAALSGRDDVVPGETFAGWEFLVPLVRPRAATLETLLPGSIVVLDEPDLLVAGSERLWKRLDALDPAPVCDPGALYLRWGEWLALNPRRRSLELAEVSLDAPHAVSVREIPSQPVRAFRNSVQAAIGEARALAANGYRVAFFASSSGELDRLGDIFTEYSLPYQTAAGGTGVSTFLVQGAVRRGVVLPDSHLALIGFEDLFEVSDLAAMPPRGRSHTATFSLETLDLQVGDFVVHTVHGVGKFVALRQIVEAGVSADFMVVEYAAGSRLYVPLTRLDLVQKHRGAGEAAPPLDKLGGVTWSRTKSRIKAKMRDMADELLKLYAERKMAEGFPFSPDSNWQREFEDAFEFLATRDQLQAAAEIKRDLEETSPMDRLLCGDVGFGKTEVAMRAAFKVLGDGKQVAVLAPTTVLALQHFETFRRRFAPFPVRVEMLSRFRSPKEIKQTLAETADGKVDVLVGTHRILSKDVEFSDLGLLVVDEEQRFGVRHKERLKQLKTGVEVLTMSATPIPRTLHMSLLGLRDMSVIETPPKDRLAIHTVVSRFQPELIRVAIEQELSRGGQVYFIHNRVETIWSRAAWVQELVPQARVTVGHGQMGEDALEKVLLSFMRHEADVFVATTIVENGLDIPLANTIIIENAERYGLSELYQLRGRVGRSNRRAYAYLLVPEAVDLSEVARKRLAALKEFSDLGAGFKIAALDLELRGAGNLLGGEQHGHIAAVGYETYIKLLDETARELRGEPVAPEIHSNLNLGLEIRIPPDYITDERQRLRAYKRVADSGDPAKAALLLAELGDRYGTPPEPVQRLIDFSRLKTLAQQRGIESIDRHGNALNLKFHPGAEIDPQQLMRLVAAQPGAQFTPAGVLRWPLPPSGPDGLFSALERLLSALAP